MRTSCTIQISALLVLQALHCRAVDLLVAMTASNRPHLLFIIIAVYVLRSNSVLVPEDTDIEVITHQPCLVLVGKDTEDLLHNLLVISGTLAIVLVRRDSEALLQNLLVISCPLAVV